jgi:hypothetical protein
MLRVAVRSSEPFPQLIRPRRTRRRRSFEGSPSNQVNRSTIDACAGHRPDEMRVEVGGARDGERSLTEGVAPALPPRPPRRGAAAHATPGVRIAVESGKSRERGLGELWLIEIRDPVAES